MPIILGLNLKPKEIAMLFRDSQNNINEAGEFINLYKIKPHPCSKKIYFKH